LNRLSKIRPTIHILMEKLQSSYKLILKPAWLLLTFFLGVVAWGQETIDNYSGFWSDDVSWVGGTAPSSPYMNLSLIINGEITHSGDLTFQSLTSLTINDTLIVDGSVDSDNGTVTISDGGLLIVKGDFTQTTNGSIIIDDGGRLIVYNAANIDCNLSVSGQLNVSGDFNYDVDSPGRIFSVNSTGSVIVGGNFNAEGGSVEFESGSYLGVLGNAEFPDNDFPTQDGEFDVLGETTGATVPTTVTDEIDPGDPILSGDITYGMHVIVFLTESDITEVPYTNNIGSAYTGVIWESTNYTTNCHLNVHASANVSFSSGLAYGTEVYLQYSIDDGISWSDASSFTEYTTGMYRCDDIEVSAGYVQIRLYANNMPDGETASLDNVTIAATNEGGTPATAIEWGEFADNICPTEVGVYSIVDHDYSSIVWSVEHGPGNIVSGQGETECEVEWIGMPDEYGTIRVTVTGGECGGSTQELFSERTVSQTDHLKVFVDKTDITCRDDNDGTINIEGRCGVAAVTYEWKSGPTVPANGTTYVDNLGPGTYRVEVSDGTYTEIVDIQIINPQALSVNLSATKPYDCSNITGGDGQLSLNVSGGWTPYDTTITRNSLAYTGELNAAPAGTYQVSITDDLGCVRSSSEVIIEQDSEDPQFATFPDDYQVDITTYNASNAEDVEVLNVSPNQTFFETGFYSTNTGVDLTRYRNFTYTITMSDNETTPVAGDSLSVYVSYNGGGDFVFLEKYSAYDADATSITGDVTLDGNPVDYSDFVLRVSVAIETSGLEYTLNSINVVADERVHDLAPSLTGTPTCSDDVSDCASGYPSYIDSEPIWGACADYDTGEFYIERNWKVQDNCGKETSDIQYISVGTAPEFNTSGFPRDTVLNFCSRTLSITAPTASDVCGASTVSWEIIDLTDNRVLDSYTDNIDAYDFPTGDTLQVVWIATDESHIQQRQEQLVLVLDTTRAEFTTNPDVSDNNQKNICLEQEVSFRLETNGGTGNYNPTYNFTPSDVSWDSENSYYTTDELTDTQPYISVEITDADNTSYQYDGQNYSVQGDCPATSTSEEFIVHDLIETNPVEREE
jgi:hypothetical protein